MGDTVSNYYYVTVTNQHGKKWRLIRERYSTVTMSEATATATTTYDIEETLTKFGFGKSDIAKVQNGQVVHVAGDTLTDRDLATMIAFKVENAGMDDAFDHIFLESPHKQESDETIHQMVVDSTTEGEGNLLFDTVQLLPQESVAEVMKLYTTFQGGDDLNLSDTEIEMFQGVGKN